MGAQLGTAAIARLRLLVALAAGYDRRPFAWAASALFGRPRVDEIDAGGVPATLFRPGRGSGPWPGVLVVPGVTRTGRRHPAFVGIGRGLAAAGFLVVVAEPDGLAIGELTPGSVHRTRQAASWVCARPDVRDGLFALAGVSGGATLALLAAADAGVAPHVSAVVALGPCCDIREALRLVTTSTWMQEGAQISYETGPFFRLVLARSTVAWLGEGHDRRTLREHTLGLEDYGTAPLAAFRTWPTEQLGPEARAIVELLANDDPVDFDRLYGALPNAQRQAVDMLSPIRVAGDISAPVELVVAREDKYVPLADAVAFARECPRARLTVIDSLEHAVPSVGLSAISDLLRLEGALSRVLAAAGSPSYSRR